MVAFVHSFYLLGLLGRAERSGFEINARARVLYISSESIPESGDGSGFKVVGARSTFESCGKSGVKVGARSAEFVSGGPRTAPGRVPDDHRPTTSPPMGPNHHSQYTNRRQSPIRHLNYTSRKRAHESNDKTWYNFTPITDKSNDLSHLHGFTPLKN